MGKKHKKKIYNTPKKIKHTHKKMSINQVIESYNNPKCITCLSNLAVHSDRSYCGNCHYSIPHNSCTEPGKELHL